MITETVAEETRDCVGNTGVPLGSIKGKRGRACGGDGSLELAGTDGKDAVPYMYQDHD